MSPANSFSEERLIFRKLELETLREHLLPQPLSGPSHPRDSLCCSATQACCLGGGGLGAYAAVRFPSSESVHIYCGKGHEKAKFSLGKTRSSSTYLALPLFPNGNSFFVVSFQGPGQDLTYASSAKPRWPCILMELLEEDDCIATGGKPTETTRGTAVSESACKLSW